MKKRMAIVMAMAMALTPAISVSAANDAGGDALFVKQKKLMLLRLKKLTNG